MRLPREGGLIWRDDDVPSPINGLLQRSCIISEKNKQINVGGEESFSEGFWKRWMGWSHEPCKIIYINKFLLRDYQEWRATFPNPQVQSNK